MKLTYDETLQRINEGQSVKHSEVQSRALNRRVWVAEWHFPGCMSESASYSATKADAVSDALGMAEGAEGPPRGMRADLLRFGRSDRTAPDAWARGAITSVSRCSLSDLLGG